MKRDSDCPHHPHPIAQPAAQGVQGAHLHCDSDRRHVHVCLVRAIRPATAQTATAGVRTLCRYGDFKKLFDSRMDSRLTRVRASTWSKDRHAGERAEATRRRKARGTLRRADDRRGGLGHAL